MWDGVACECVAVMSALHRVTEVGDSYDDTAGAHSIRITLAGLLPGGVLVRLTLRARTRIGRMTPPLFRSNRSMPPLSDQDEFSSTTKIRIIQATHPNVRVPPRKLCIQNNQTDRPNPVLSYYQNSNGDIGTYQSVTPHSTINSAIPVQKPASAIANGSPGCTLL